MGKILPILNVLTDDIKSSKNAFSWFIHNFMNFQWFLFQLGPSVCN